MNYIKLLLVLGAFTAQVACKGPKQLFPHPNRQVTPEKKSFQKETDWLMSMLFTMPIKKKSLVITSRLQPFMLNA
jgi:hypothetical protein